MCKHVAAALYGAGARLDAEPDLLFRLRAVDAGQIFANLDAALPASRSGGAETRLDASDLSDIFGIDMAASASSPKPKTNASPAAARKVFVAGQDFAIERRRRQDGEAGPHSSNNERRRSPSVWRCQHTSWHENIEFRKPLDM